MNKIQKAIVIIYSICLILITIVFVPWLHRTNAFGYSFIGYGPLWNPPQHLPFLSDQINNQLIDFTRLFVEFLVLSGVCFLLFKTFETKQQ